MPNRLINEKSPYLLQHAHNPVDWYPWTQEAFGAAKEKGLPIFLSIGYATCHWCHVMEKESFESAEVAALLNENFICIKVDREERPDVDKIYMTALTQILRQHGGWPMSMWLTSELRPFYGGTYFPPTSRYGRPGFAELLGQITDLWKNSREKLLSSAEEIQLQLKTLNSFDARAQIDFSVVERSFATFIEHYDQQNGGFGSAPKFPQISNLNFLLAVNFDFPDKKALSLVQHQLDAMIKGGIYDQIGGGFSRYSVDEKWRVPHFEKMLYDNAQIVRVLAECCKIAPSWSYKKIINDTVNYILNDLTHSNGGFYSAQDADSEGIEGKFYVWTKKEIMLHLAKNKPEQFCQLFGITEEGNWQDDHDELDISKNVPFLGCTLESAPTLLGLATQDFVEWLDQCRKILFENRSQRIRPIIDRKILTSWNGLMISALAIAHPFLSDDKALGAAEKCADFLQNQLIKKGELNHQWCDGEIKEIGLLEDYSFLVAGLLDLYETNLNVRWLNLAWELNQRAIELFMDQDSSFFLTRDQQPDLIVRSKDYEDGAIPSASGVMVSNCIRLSELYCDQNLKTIALKSIESLGMILQKHPLAVPSYLSAYVKVSKPFQQIVIAGNPNEFLKCLTQQFFARTVILSAHHLQNDLTRGKSEIQGKPTLYSCQQQTCSEPITDPGKCLNLSTNRSVNP